MCLKADSDIDWNGFQFFRADYEILEQKELGLPNCLHCGEEPIEIWTTEEICNEHRVHFSFKPCQHVIGLVT